MYIYHNSLSPNVNLDKNFYITAELVEPIWVSV